MFPIGSLISFCKINVIKPWKWVSERLFLDPKCPPRWSMKGELWGPMETSMPMYHARMSHGLSMCKGISKKENTIGDVQECVDPY